MTDTTTPSMRKDFDNFIESTNRYFGFNTRESMFEAWQAATANMQSKVAELEAKIAELDNKVDVYKGALDMLKIAKEYKDSYGKTDAYESMRKMAWENAYRVEELEAIDTAIAEEGVK